MPDYYGTVSEADAYWAARANAAWTGSDQVKQAALLRASVYIDGRYRKMWPSGRWESLFPGIKTGGRSQTREWPRSAAADYEGNAIAPTEIPLEVQQATYEAALRELVSPGSLSPDYVASERVTMEKVGPLEVEYADADDGDAAPNRPVITVIDEIIAPVLVARYLLPSPIVV